MHNNNNYQCKICWSKDLTLVVGSIQLSFRIYIVFTQYMQRCFQSKCYYISAKLRQGFVLFIYLGLRLLFAQICAGVPHPLRNITVHLTVTENYYWPASCVLRRLCGRGLDWTVTDMFVRMRSSHMILRAIDRRIRQLSRFSLLLHCRRITSSCSCTGISGSRCAPS